MTNPGTIFSNYNQFFVGSLRGRYITLDHIEATLNSMQHTFDISVIGRSENGLEIPMIRIGTGRKKVLAWSQMHGNESTTTKAVIDFMSFFCQKDRFQEEVLDFLSTYSFYVIPILNPDGALLYTRENKNGVDLNRDAQLMSQSESKVLATVFEKIQPDLCLNLHDQRTIYGASQGMPATVSFLSPSADETCTMTNSRAVAVKHIERMTSRLQQYIPGQVGRYDDGFNANCVGDTFQMKEVPTILFEAGHYPNDYEREETRKYIFLALLALFDLELNLPEAPIIVDYLSIPENTKGFRDVVLRNVMSPTTRKLMTLALQYEEVLKEGSINFQAIISEIDEFDGLIGHLEVDVKGASILIDSHEIFEIGQNISTICSKSDPSVVYFSMK